MRNASVLCLVAALTAAFGLVLPNDAAAAELTHQWVLNESEGTTANDSVGGLHGTLQNFDDPPAWQNPGLEFQRLGQMNAGNDRIDGFSGALSHTGFSLTAWITPDVVDAQEIILAQRSGSADRSQWGLSNGLLWGGKNDSEGTGTTTLVSGTQYLVAWTFDGSATRGYVDGNLEYTAPNTYTAGFDSQGNTIGAFADSNFGFDGLMRDLRTYEGALTELELQDLHEAGPVPEPTSFALAALGLLSLALWGWRRRR